MERNFNVNYFDIRITMYSFEHIKSYELPPNYQNIIKKGYKNPIP